MLSAKHTPYKHDKLVYNCIFNTDNTKEHSIITGPPTNSVGRGGRLVLLVGVCRRLSSVKRYGGSAGGCNREGQAMTSCQSNYNSTAARRASSVTSR